MPPLRSDAVLSGRYRLVSSVGVGGNGAVWRAHDQVLDRHVAVKLLHENLELDDAVRARFRREAMSAASIHHPHAAIVYDIGEDDGRPYLVMELVDGPALDDLMDGRPVDAGLAAAIGHQVAGALGAAHERGLAHRDVKPGNILLTRDGAAKVVDFGIAKALGDVTQQLTAVGTVVGTAAYLAPEQLEPGAQVDGRADVYALGLLLHELVTGRSPFDGSTAAEVAAQRLVSDVPTPLDHHGDVPAGIAAVIERATRRDPADRFADGGELAAALAPHVPDRPLQVVAEFANQAPTIAAATQALVVEEPEAGRTQRLATQPGSDDTLLIPTAAASETVAIPVDRTGNEAGRDRDPAPAPAARRRPEDRNDTPQVDRPAAAPAAAAAPAPAAAARTPAPSPGRTGGHHADDQPAGRWPRRTGLVAGIVVVGLAVLAAISLDGGTGTGGGADGAGGDPAAGDPAGPYRIAAAADVDPYGGDGEHPEDLGAAFDGDPSTSWPTQRYSTPDFGGLKPGVGIAFDLGEAVEVSQVQLLLATAGVDLEVYASDAPFQGTDFGEPVGAVADAPAEPTVDVGGARGRYWLIWFTEVPGGRAEVVEAEFDRPA